MTDEKAIEAMARALCQHEGHNPDGASSWFNDAKLWEEWTDPATAALAAYRRHQAEAGIVEVSREPTDSMHDAFFVARDNTFYAQMKAAKEAGRGWKSMPAVIWDAMIAAAQEKDG